MRIGLHVKCLLFLSDFNETGIFFRQIFEKYSNIELRENPCSRSRVAACGWVGGRTETDTAKLTVAFPSFANVPEKCNVQWLILYLVERLVTECGSL
jgi:hypothetical protein